MTAKGNGHKGNGKKPRKADSGKPTGGKDEPQDLTKAVEEKPKHELGHHPNQVLHHFPPGVAQNPGGRPPGIPNLNDLLMTEAKSYRRGKGKKARGFLMHLLDYAAKHPNSKLTEKILDKILADATPQAGGPQVNVSNQINNEHSLHSTILNDPAVREAALAFEERIAGSLRDARGNGAGD